jgi:predicted AlkP superfamily phosphohydrolase/phosphomutase
VRESRAYTVLRSILAGILAGLLIGVCAGSIIGMRTVTKNLIGFTLDSVTIGVYFALIYGALFAAAGLLIGLLFSVLAVPGRPLRTGTVFAGTAGIVTALYLFLSAMRIFNEDLYFYEYSYINSYRAMQMFFAFRTILIGAASVGCGYGLYRLTRRAPRVVVTSLVVLIALAGLVVNFACRMPEQTTTTWLPPIGKDASVPGIILLGWDGATWVVMDRLIEQGLMPNTQDLIERGARAYLKTIRNTVSPDIWTTIYTGKGKGHHGIYDFTYFTIPGIRRPLVFPSRGLGVARMLNFALRRDLIDAIVVNRSFRRSTPVWCIMNKMGRSAGVVGPLVSWPVEEVQPFIISSMAGDVARKVRKGEIKPEAMISGEVYFPQDLDDRAISWILKEERWEGAVGPYLYEKYRPDFFTSYTNQPDGTQHFKWKWMEPQYYAGVTEEDLARYGGAIVREYVFVDSVLGAFMKLAGDSTNIIIVSDHGFSPSFRSLQQAGHYHGPPGILIACGPSIPAGVEIEHASVFDITPTILALAGIPVAEDMEGRVLEDMIRPEFLVRHPVDFTSTYETGSARTVVRKSGIEKDLYKKLQALGYIGN